MSFLSPKHSIADHLDPSSKNNKINFTPSGILNKHLKHREIKNEDIPFPCNSCEPESKFYLFVLLNKTEEKMYRITNSRTIIGKNTDLCDFVINQDLISNRHAIIQFRTKKSKVSGESESVPYLMDFNSTNKTLLNEQEIEPLKYYELFDGDIVHLGSKKVEIVMVAK